MKAIRKCAGKWATLCSLVWVGTLMAGCDTPRFEPVDKLGLQDNNSVMGTGDKLRIGDQLMITFSATAGGEPILPPHAETIKEDGTITPPLLGAVMAVGKTPGTLQSELQTNYDRLYNKMTVTVTVQNRFYYVSGEVRKPGPEPYLGETDIIKAISAAGDFTDFANKRKVKITRANGQVETVDVQKIIDEPQSFDVPIYPGDKIVVRRRFL